MMTARRNGRRRRAGGETRPGAFGDRSRQYPRVIVSPISDRELMRLLHGRRVHVHDGGCAGALVFASSGNSVAVALRDAGGAFLLDEFAAPHLEAGELAERAAEWLTRERQWFEVGELIDR